MRTIIFLIIILALMVGAKIYLDGLPTQPTESEKVFTEEPMAQLEKEDLRAGEGAEAKNGDKLTVHYLGVLKDGLKFDSSYDRGQPFVFTLGAGQVIKGWDLGLLGMKIGGKRKLIIPAVLGYGATGAGSVIPPNADLIFEVELLAIE